MRRFPPHQSKGQLACDYFDAGIKDPGNSNNKKLGTGFLSGYSARGGGQITILKIIGGGGGGDTTFFLYICASFTQYCGCVEQKK